MFLDVYWLSFNPWLSKQVILESPPVLGMEHLILIVAGKTVIAL